MSTELIRCSERKIGSARKERVTRMGLRVGTRLLKWPRASVT